MKLNLLNNKKRHPSHSVIMKPFIMVFAILFTLYSCSDDDEVPIEQPDPELAISPETLDFGDVSESEASSVLSYQITKENLDNDITVTSSGNGFQVSKSEAGNFTENVVLNDADFSSNTSLVYVRFTPQGSTGTANGTVTHSADGLNENVVLTVTVNVIQDEGQPGEGSLQWVESFNYEGDIVPAEVNTNSGDDNRTISSDLWIAVREGTDGIALTDESLSFEGYPLGDQNRTIRLFNDGTAESNDAYARNFDTFITADADNNVTSEHSTIYVSFLYKLEENQTAALTWPVSIGEWADAGTSNFNTRVLVDVKPDENSRIGIQFGGKSTRQFVDDVVEVGKTYLIVVKNEKMDGSEVNDNGSVFVFEAGSNIPAEEPTPTVQTDGPIKRHNEIVVLTENNASNTALVGEIRLANNWADLFN
jgi:hypothetical protein